MNDQRSPTAQLRELFVLANKHGLYDAADFVLAHADRIDRSELEAAGIDVDGACQHLQSTIDRLAESARARKRICNLCRMPLVDGRCMTANCWARVAP